VSLSERRAGLYICQYNMAWDVKRTHAIQTLHVQFGG